MPADPSASPLPALTDENRALAGRAAARRLAMQGDNAQLRLRYEEVLRWTNPPWDAFTRRVDPRPEEATAERGGEAKFHFDQVGQAVLRWSVLEMGAPVSCRVEPTYTPEPIPNRDPQHEWNNRQQYQIDRAVAQLQASQMEDMTREWIRLSNFDRTLLWAAWAKRAFGKSILRDGWDAVSKHPTLELMENPSQVAYGWTTRYGNRVLAWVNVAEQMMPEEVNSAYNVDIPIDDGGTVQWSTWSGADVADFDMRPEQTNELNQMVWIEEYWELDREAKTVTQALIIGGRVVDGPNPYPWKRLPFHVLENEHIPTYLHGKSTAEQMISGNAAYDDMVDRQHEVITFESGPRYMGLNMFNSGDMVQVPKPFQMVPLREGEEIRQIETRVDFFPAQLHSDILDQALYKGTGLTPIAWGMSPNAQTSGRAMSAEWRAVELPLTYALVSWTPEITDIWTNWWDFAEAYDETAKKIGKGYRRFIPKFLPLDIRDKTEKTLEVVQLLQANLVDPETALEQLGFENGDEILARVKIWLVDPIYNPLRYQQYLVLQQVEIQIQMQQIQLQQAQQQQQAVAAQQQQAQAAQQQQQAGGPPGQLAAQGQQAAVQQAQGPGGPVGPAQNQPGQSPGGGGLPLDIGLLSRTPLEGGSGNQIQVHSGPGAPQQGAQPTAGLTPR